ncbi:MAG: hypothetical protein ACREKN_06335 [Longimicrobiaceae bacterium]
MKRFLLPSVTLFLAGLAGCGSPEVVVEAALESPDGDRSPLAELPIYLLPYDRDAIFDSLAADADDPEPEIPAEIAAQQAEIQEAEAAWRAAEGEWGQVRERMRALSAQLREMQGRGLRGTPQYRRRFQEFRQLEGREQAAEQESRQAFQDFDQLQQGVFAQADSIRVARVAWADRAFADYGEVVEAKLALSGEEEIADTTDASGVVSIAAPEGRWWVHARYELPYQELYWNLPVEVTGDSVHVRLSDQNAQERPTL